MMLAASLSTYTLVMAAHGKNKKVGKILRLSLEKERMVFCRLIVLLLREHDDEETTNVLRFFFYDLSTFFDSQ